MAIIPGLVSILLFSFKEFFLYCCYIYQFKYIYDYIFIFIFRGTPQQRRSRYDRNSGHRASFDLLQAELESLVETLSGEYNTTIHIISY